MTLGLMIYPILISTRVVITLFEVLVLILLVLPASQLAIEATNYLTTRILPADSLPKLDFSINGIPDAFRTLVVIPMLLTDENTIKEEIEKLEIRYLGNKGHNLIYSLFSDFIDADTEVTELDDGLLHIAEEGIRKFNQKYGDGRFYHFHRQRTWSESEGKYIGWERKRGKLEELNRLILGLRHEDEPSVIYVGEADQLTDIRYIITLDSDTQLPKDSATRMVETLAHPLNQPRFNENGQVAQGTYSLIQPRVSPSLPSAVASLFSRIYTDPVGTDPYTKAVSNAYQDLSGEGSYIGKGIYDPRFFYKILEDRFPDEYLLSHDLIEGAHVRTGLATDIELFDEFPADYISYSRRQHRWIRGDWQIMDWIFPRVPNRNHQRVSNPLSILNRWKIFDNLRRSLVPSASVAALLVSWFFVQPLQLFTSVLAAGLIFFQPLAGPLTWVTSRHGFRSFSFRQIKHDLGRAFAEAAMLMHQAGLAIDAIATVFYRRLISKRGLLEWSTAQMTERSATNRQHIFQYKFWLISLISIILALSLYLLHPVSLLFALPWLSLWFISPYISGLLIKKQLEREPFQLLSGKDTHMLRRVARRSWRYFDDFVNDDTAWLPPDNYQVSHQNQLAMRTSPTNIGMWMLSVLGANDFGYITLDQTIDRLTRTMRTLNKLERHEGHLLNWYNLEDLESLRPRYVSFVDSGNFLAALWTLSQGINEIIERPILRPSVLGGIQDTAEILLEELKKEKSPGDLERKVLELLDLINECPTKTIELIRLIRLISVKVGAITALLKEKDGTYSRSVYWARKIESQVAAWTDVIDRYLGWIEILAERSEEEISHAGLDNLIVLRRELDQSPSLKSLTAGNLEGINNLDPEHLSEDLRVSELTIWIERLFDSFERAKWFSSEMFALGGQLQEMMQLFSDEINLDFLYDPTRSLFSIGYNVTTNQLDGSYYDLLASEARLGSYVAIARGDVPVDHWLALNRPYSSHGMQRVLLSWTGTMFEYLMPLLLQKTYPNSLLDHATREGVKLQQAYGQRRRVPWGISESAYGDLDQNKTYQYKAFGVPWLGLKRGLDEDLVVAPYATLLAVDLDPKATVKNLEWLATYGLLADYGYFEAIDFNRRPRANAEPGVIVRAYMAHHQGMAFLSLTNFLCGHVMQDRFHKDPRVKVAEPLLYERVPVSPPIHHISTRVKNTVTNGFDGCSAICK